MITDTGQVGFQEVRVRAHANCVVCSPANGRSLRLACTPSGDGGVQARFDCDESFQGYAGMLHGGVITSLLDGAMTNCMFSHGTAAITAELNVRFRHPVVTNQAATIHAWIERSSPPLHLLRAELVQNGQLQAVACGKFMERARPLVTAHEVRRLEPNAGG